MKNLLVATAAIALAFPASAQEEAEPALSPNQIVENADASDWVAISAEDLLVMTLAPGSNGLDRQVIMQLMPAPFSQGWVENIRTLARAGWYDGISVNRVQDNYVVQWGDPDADNRAAEGEAKALPKGLRVMGESQYAQDIVDPFTSEWFGPLMVRQEDQRRACVLNEDLGEDERNDCELAAYEDSARPDPYSRGNFQIKGWPLATGADEKTWPIHCYGMIGVGRSYSPDTGTGAELYTVIGHAPRHLDRNIALVGRVIDGIEYLSSLPRGTGPLGFYETAEERVPIQSIRVVSDLPDQQQPAFEYLSTESEAFARYADARANRRDAFFIEPAGGADICNIPVPVRRVVESASD